MSDYTLSQIRPTDRRALAQLDGLLAGEGIHRDANLDYMVGLYDGDWNMVATGSCFANTLRCLAVSESHQGEGLLCEVVSHLVDYEMRRGNAHLFLYTKCDKIPFFAGLGFYEIVRVDGRVAFMENRRDGFSSYLKALSQTKSSGRCAALVMNCNPFTLGHRYLAEHAAAQNDVVHLFVVSEDASLIPFADRYAMVKSGCAGLDNLVIHKTDSYMISGAVFPSYFFEDEESVIEAHARLDLTLFKAIASVLGVTRRYVGEEPFSRVTNIYNAIMREELPTAGIECVVIPRLELNGQAISASRVRQIIHEGRLEDIRPMVPQSTFDYFLTDSGREVTRTIKDTSSVTHY